METTAYKNHIVSTFSDSLRGVIDALPIGDDIFVRAIDIATFCDRPVRLITSMASDTSIIRQINLEEHGGGSTNPGKQEYIELKAAEEVIKSLNCDSSIAKAFMGVKRKIRTQLRPNDFHLRCGNYISSLLLYSAAAEDSDINSWIGEVVDINPLATKGTGFHQENGPESDFPVPLNLVKKIAMQNRTVGCMLLMHALIESGYFERSLIREKFHVSLGVYHGMIHPGIGFTSAAKLHEFLNPTVPFAVWLYGTTANMNLDSEIDFLCYSKKGFKLLGGLDSAEIIYLSPWLTKMIILSNQLPKTANQIFARLYFSGGNLASLMAIHPKVLCQNNDSPEEPMW